MQNIFYLPCSFSADITFSSTKPEPLKRISAKDSVRKQARDSVLGEGDRGRPEGLDRETKEKIGGKATYF